MFEAQIATRSCPFQAAEEQQLPIAGVAIDVELTAGTPRFVVTLLSGEMVPAGTVADTTDETAARRVWTLLARVMGQPRFVALHTGGYRALDRVIGGVVARNTIARRWRRTGARRRPPTRQCGAAARVPPVVYTDEREIVCYE